MATQLRSSRWEMTGPASPSDTGAREGAKGWERLLQAVLAIYLVPALLIVLAVGGLGLLVLAAGRVIAWAVPGPGRTSVADSPAVSGVEKHGRP